MLKRGGAKRSGPLTYLNQARHVVSIIREMSLDEIRADAERVPAFLLLSDDPDAPRILEELTGVTGTPSLAVERTERVPKDIGRYDAVIVHHDAHGTVLPNLRNQLGETVFDLLDASRPGWADDLRSRIVERLPGQATAIGRWYPAFRPVAALQVVNDTARANGQFALVANLPAVVPIIGGLTSIGADLIVLTKNQLTMAIKIAAIYGRPLDDRMQILREVAPVAGSGFLWRTLAREATSFIPLAGGTIPKVAIAYAGTVSTGRAIDFYYRYGERPSKEQLRRFYQQAFATAKRVIPGLKAEASQDGATPPTP